MAIYKYSVREAFGEAGKEDEIKKFAKLGTDFKKQIDDRYREQIKKSGDFDRALAEACEQLNNMQESILNACGVIDTKMRDQAQRVEDTRDKLQKQTEEHNRLTANIANLKQSYQAAKAIKGGDASEKYFSFSLKNAIGGEEMRIQTVSSFEETLKTLTKELNDLSKDIKKTKHEFNKEKSELQKSKKKKQASKSVVGDDSDGDVLASASIGGNLLSGIKDSYYESRENKNSVMSAVSDGLVGGLKKAVAPSGGVLSSVIDSLITTIKNVGNIIVTGIDSALSDYESIVVSNLGKLNSILQGDNPSTSDSIVELISQVEKRAIDGESYTFSTKELTEKLVDLVSNGYIKDAEQKALLAMYAQDIVSQFDVANQQLVQLSRLRSFDGIDTTSARLGMEAAIQNFLSDTFQDTSYINNNFNSVQEALSEASARMNTIDSIEFEYQVQKWLGGLYAEGASNNLISSLATAIGNLAAGDIKSLSGSKEQTLLATAANNAGLDYGSILVNGLKADDTNRLLQSITEYLSGIQENTQNQNALAKAYGEVFGASLSDIQAANNLIKDGTVFKDIINDTQSDFYNTLVKELGYATSEYRTDQTTKLKNWWEDTKWNTASRIYESDVVYGGYKTTQLLASLTEGTIVSDIAKVVSGLGTAITMVVDMVKEENYAWDAFGKSYSPQTELANYFLGTDYESYVQQQYSNSQLDSTSNSNVSVAYDNNYSSNSMSVLDQFSNLEQTSQQTYSQLSGNIVSAEDTSVQQYGNMYAEYENINVPPVEVSSDKTATEVTQLNESYSDYYSYVKETLDSINTQQYNIYTGLFGENDSMYSMLNTKFVQLIDWQNIFDKQLFTNSDSMYNLMSSQLSTINTSIIGEDNSIYSTLKDNVPGIYNVLSVDIKDTTETISSNIEALNLQAEEIFNLLNLTFSEDGIINVNIKTIGDDVVFNTEMTDGNQEILNTMLSTRLQTVDNTATKLGNTINSDRVDINISNSDISLQEMMLVSKNRKLNSSQVTNIIT